jgi:hypothetical protein
MLLLCCVAMHLDHPNLSVQLGFNPSTTMVQPRLQPRSTFAAAPDALTHGPARHPNRPMNCPDLTESARETWFRAIPAVPKVGFGGG